MSSTRARGQALTRQRAIRRTRGDMARRYRSRIATAAVEAGLHQISPVAGTVFRVAKTAKGMYDKWKTTRAKGTAKGYRSYNAGVFAGRFRKPNKKGMQSWKTKYAANGFVNTTEVTGKINDPNCCYLIHTATPPPDTIKIIVESLLRKLIRKSIKFNVTNLRQEIPGESFFNTSDRFEFRLIRAYTDGTTNVLANRVTVDNDSVYTIAQYFIPFFRSFAQGDSPGDSNNSYELERMQLYIKDTSVVNHATFIGEINLKNETVHLYSMSEMKIQNRSLSATGSADAENVTNNPLVGYHYQFSGGVPRSKTMDCQELQYIGLSGVTLARAGQWAAGPGGEVTFREPPLPRLFSNCRKASKVRLDPGSIKEDRLVHTVHYNLIKYLKKVGYATGFAGNASRIMWVPGKCHMFAFEDVINVNEANLIEIAYEVNRQMGCYLTTNRAPLAGGDFQQETLNNLTA